MTLADKIKELPRSPGVYFLKAGPEILYIGKAKDLKSRVGSYFTAGRDSRYAVKFLVSRVDGLDYIVTSTEKEALILEDTLLKKHKPRYNIRLKDDKTYVSIKLTVHEKFPRISITRAIKDDGSRYFGPYVSATMARDTLKFLRRIFPLCVCSAHEFRNRTRPCLDYQLGLCSSPATGLISEAAYGEFVAGAAMFLDGRAGELIKGLKKKMLEASNARDYEAAAALRDRIRSIEATVEEQKVVSDSGADEDVFAFAEADGLAAVAVFFVREGRLTGKRDFVFKSTGLPAEEVMGSFLSQFYSSRGRFIPDSVFANVEPDGAEAVTEWLSGKKGKKVYVSRPVRGEKRRLLQMAGENALEALKKKKTVAAPSPLEELKARLGLSRIPSRIEAFDISNLGGSEPVGAMVVFKDGSPHKDGYRRYKIKDAAGPDDYAMMKEVLSRRYRDAAQQDLPDLILMDGGKGQLGVALAVLGELGIKGAPAAALAKERELKILGGRKVIKGERVYLPGVKDPVLLKEGSRGDLLLRRIRDEVHRFAVSYHRKLRSRRIGSALDEIPGIGAKKRKAIFDRFADMDGIKNASIEELTEVPGVTRELACAIKTRLEENG